MLLAHYATAVLINRLHAKTRSRHLLKSGSACYQACMYAVGSRLFCAAAATPQGRYKLATGTGAVLLNHRKQVHLLHYLACMAGTHRAIMDNTSHTRCNIVTIIMRVPTAFVEARRPKTNMFNIAA